MRPNPASDDYRGFPTIHRQWWTGQSAPTWRRLLRELEKAFTGTPPRWAKAVPIMYGFAIRPRR